MKLLLDENLSSRLLSALERDFPGSQHIRDVGHSGALDDEVWRFAAENGFAILSKDSDFHQRSFLWGAPPKVVWLRVGNRSTKEIADLLSARAAEIRRFATDEDTAFLVLS